MIKSLFVSFTASLFFTFGAAAQTVPHKIEQLAKDPQTAERAAKADVYIMGHKIADEPANSKDQKQVMHKKKRKNCKRK